MRKIITLLKKLEFCLPTNYPLRKYIRFEFPNIVNKLTSEIYLEKLFEYTTLNWSKIYLLPRLAATYTILRFFQYKILNNGLFLNKKLYTFGIASTFLCSFCKILEETPIHIFCDCIHVKSIREKLQTKFQNDIFLPSLKLQAAILELINKANNIFNVLNQVLLIFKYYGYTM